MKSPVTPCSSGIIEALESRIAPAQVIITGVPDFPSKVDKNYSDAPFVNTETAQGDPIAAAVGGGAPGVADTFYLKMSAGDRLKVFNNTNGPEDYLVVKTGTLVAFFIDDNHNNEVNEGELVSLSVGRNTSFELRAGLTGDIVANLNPLGTDFEALSPTHGIQKVLIGGSVKGKVLSGGDISNLTVSAGVGGILAGTATNNVTFNFLPSATPGFVGNTFTATFAEPAGHVGSSISTIFVKSVDGLNARIEAGAGGAGARGGSLVNIHLTGDPDGATFKAGDGGDGSEGLLNGGAGGGISAIFVSSSQDTAANGPVRILAGAGGDGITNGPFVGAGGAGGFVTKTFIGYQQLGNKAFPSNVLLHNNVVVSGGAGGFGRIGGVGGVVSNVSVLVSVPDAAGDEVAILSGAGGNNTDPNSGRAGNGGSIVSVNVLNQDLLSGSDILVQAGNGGDTVGFAPGAAGGSIAKVQLLGSDHRVLAGNGSAGRIGGAGGSLSSITLLQSEGVLAHSAVFDAGHGGTGQAGAGGPGGNIANLRTVNGDFDFLKINEVGSGDGGVGNGGKGGRGGFVVNVDLVDSGINVNNSVGSLAVRSGNGGSGSTGGGAGGVISKARASVIAMNATLTSGVGGSATGSLGNGGAGGDMSSVEVTVIGKVNGVNASATLNTGVGGNGVGPNAVGGKGGDARVVDVRVGEAIASSSVPNGGSATLIAGNGGNAPEGRVGNGGNILLSALFATNGNGQMIAGNAGATGVKAGNGGSISGLSTSRVAGLYADANLTIQAGDGTHGGSGGSLRFIGYGSPQHIQLLLNQAPNTPTGDILIAAGDGSGEGLVAGKGGSISFLDGTISSGAGKATTIVAGNGGSSADALAGGAGGSIVETSLALDGVFPNPNVTTTLGSVVTITAGDGGDTGTGTSGGVGGSVAGLRISNISSKTIVRSIAGGDGGDGVVKGGAGGSITAVDVLNHDIGIRTGVAYGYGTMGGLFAGVGGQGSVVGKAGSVIGVKAQSISAIVAGKGAKPDFAEVVANITVGPVVSPLRESTGAFIKRLPSAPGTQSQFVLITPGGPTAPINFGATTTDVHDKLLAKGVNVTVTAVPGGGYTFTYNSNGDVAQITAEEFATQTSTLIANGTELIPVTEGVPGTADDAEVQTFINQTALGLAKPFVVRIEGFPTKQTAVLAADISPSDLTIALNKLISDVYGAGTTLAVDVTFADDNKTYVIAFNSAGDQPFFQVTAQQPESQELRVLATGEFSVQFGTGANSSTARLPFNIPATGPGGLQEKLNALTTVSAAGGVTVTGGPNGVFDIQFNAIGDKGNFQFTQFASLPTSTLTPGDAVTPEVQQVTTPAIYAFDPAKFAQATLVGAIANIVRPDAWKFQFVDQPGGTPGVYDVAIDLPIDGLIVAKVYQPTTTNFTPEARVANGEFIDFDNKI